MEGLPGIHVPIIYTELSTSKIITQEFVEGVKVSDVESIEAAGLDREEIARNALRALIKQLPVDGFFHADPHPGNLLVNLDTGVLTFIDLGMMGELDVQKRLRLAQLMVVAQQGSAEGMASALRGMSVPIAGEVDEKGYRRDFVRRMGRYMGQGRTTSFGQIANEGFEVLRVHGLRLDSDLTLAVKALVQTESVARALSTGSGLIAEGVPMLRDMVLESITGEKILDIATKQVMASAGEVIERLPTLGRRDQQVARPVPEGPVRGHRGHLAALQGGRQAHAARPRDRHRRHARRHARRLGDRLLRHRRPRPRDVVLGLRRAARRRRLRRRADPELHHRAQARLALVPRGLGDED